MQEDSPDGPSQRDPRPELPLRRDLRPALAAVLRAAEVPRAFRMAIVPLVALRELAGFGFVVVDRFLVVAFFFGDAAADFFWVVRFLAAPIAAPERPPITVPTTGAPSADPATAPATAPPSVLAVGPMPVSTALPS
jgi:hypothetical protein